MGLTKEQMDSLRLYNRSLNDEGYAFDFIAEVDKLSNLRNEFDPSVFDKFYKKLEGEKHLGEKHLGEKQMETLKKIFESKQPARYQQDIIKDLKKMAEEFKDHIQAYLQTEEYKTWHRNLLFKEAPKYLSSVNIELKKYIESEKLGPEDPLVSLNNRIETLNDRIKKSETDLFLELSSKAEEELYDITKGLESHTTNISPGPLKSVLNALKEVVNKIHRAFHNMDLFVPEKADIRKEVDSTRSMLFFFEKGKKSEKQASENAAAVTPEPSDPSKSGDRPKF